ncbi:hypothetical protein DBV15_10075 [Temnothorax longispinosus]|uniref:Uncharacterized protein n=1 Tax=Temnothorax longispinosus TaxID=300112 RepID=A0A4S2KWF8_9HYME|nr:hypothetical protein DBV15_10075 [Temnothorax longispinosus]
MPVAQEPGLIDLEPTGISSWLVAMKQISAPCDGGRADGGGAVLALVRRFPPLCLRRCC